MAKRSAKRIGLAIVGGGRVGLIRGEIAARHPQVDFIGLAEIKPDRAREVAEKIGADFVTSDYRELFARPEVTAAIISTDEHLHVDPILAAVERRLSLFIEKPLATELTESERVLMRWSDTRSDSAGAGLRRRKKSGRVSSATSRWSRRGRS